MLIHGALGEPRALAYGADPDQAFRNVGSPSPGWSVVDRAGSIERELARRV